MDERDVYRAKEAMHSAMKQAPMRLAVIIGAILVFFLFSYFIPYTSNHTVAHPPNSTIIGRFCLWFISFFGF